MNHSIRQKSYSSEPIRESAVGYFYPLNQNKLALVTYV